METPIAVDQLVHPAILFIAAQPALLARKGTVVATWRRRNGRTFGPYYRLAYRQEGRQSAIYLGRDGPVVHRVRQMLDALQKPLRQKRLFDRIERQTRHALRANHVRIAALLRPYGLHLKGLEIRGWRTSPLRPWLPRRPRLARAILRPSVRPLPRFTFPVFPSTRRHAQRKHTKMDGPPLIGVSSDRRTPFAPTPSTESINARMQKATELVRIATHARGRSAILSALRTIPDVRRKLSATRPRPARPGGESD